jgi:hypothetical protein
MNESLDRWVRENVPVLESEQLYLGQNPIVKSCLCSMNMFSLEICLQCKDEN